MEKTYKNCQSCGMPLKRDPKGGGTNADGSKSNMYCSHCYQTGKFTLPDLTVDQMKDRLKGIMKEMGFPGFLGKLYANKISKLERWRQAK